MVLGSGDGTGDLGMVRGSGDELFSPPEIKMASFWVIEGDDIAVTCDTKLDPLRAGTELYFTFYRDGENVQDFSVSDTYTKQSTQLEDSGNYTCEVRTATDTVKKRSNELYIQINSRAFFVTILAVAIVGGLLAIVLSAVIIWRCRNRKESSASSQASPQETDTMVTDANPDPQDVCYTYLELSHLPKEEPRTYHWYKDNKPIPGDQQSLQILNSTVEDSGDYQCQINSIDISAPVFLNVAINFVILQRPPSICEGDLLTLRCHHVKGFTAINTRFYRDDKEVQSSDTDPELHLTNAETKLSGVYKCTKQIQHQDGLSVHEHSDVSSISVKELFSPPKIEAQLRVIEGDDMTVRCDTRLDPLRASTELQFAFYKDRQTVQKFSLSDTYRVRPAHLENSGSYTCDVRTVTDTLRKRSYGLYIEIHELFSTPEIKVTPHRVKEGDDMVVTCDTKLDPLRADTELQFAFYRDGRTVQEFNVSDTYRVQSAQLEDSGNYTCEVRTGTENVRKMSDGSYIQITKELFSTPKIKTLLRVIEGGDMVMRCDTRLDPLRAGTELQFAFYRDGRNVQEFSVSDTYRVRSAQLENSGKYTCEVRTATDTVRKRSDELYIRIHELFSPPKIITTLRITERDDMTVRCDTRLDPLRGGTQLQFAFYRDGRTVQEFNVSDTYRVRSAQQEDSGKYTCEVRTATDTVRKRSDEFYIRIH
ncbi:PREDICTED: Fc receptor-like protein 3, partial [Nanorana parkeri]|uniref:Fc receptor-like protein 3 n=1 Tax=Nanorana parkeri TaxID=125878 RepID=UPI000854FEA9